MDQRSAHIAHSSASEEAGASAAGSAGLGLVLTALLFVPVAVFFGFAAFNPAALAVPLQAGKPVTIWFVYGVGLIVFALVLSGIYMVVSNRAVRVGAAVLAVVAAATPAHAQVQAQAGAEAAGPNMTAVALFLALVL